MAADNNGNGENGTTRRHRSTESNGFARLDAEIERLDQLRAADQKAVGAALAAADKAVAAALTAAEKATSKAELAQSTLIQLQADQIQEMRSRLDVGPPSLATLQTRSDENVGRREGSSATQATIISVAGVAAVIGGVISGIVFNLMGQ